MLQFIDIFFVIFHSALILFNLFGWIVPRMRKAHLVCVLLTGGSWFVLGLFYGIGYCPLTDWHWQVLRKMGETRLPASYVQYILERITGISVSARTADVATVAGWMVALLIAVYLQVKKLLANKKEVNRNGLG